MMKVALESFANCRADIERVAPEQWQEAGDLFTPLAPNWKLYLGMESAGVATCLVGRVDGEFVGYMGVAIHHNPNSASLKQATIPTYWVKPSIWRALRLRRLFISALKLARDKGANQVLVDTSLKCSCGPLLRALGFNPRSISYVLPLEA